MKKKKTYLAVRKVREFIATLPDEAQAEYQSIVDRLEMDGYLVEPFAKKLDSGLFEIRVRRGHQVRIFYFYHEDNIVFGVHAFMKKTQQTPLHELRQAMRVATQIKRGKYDE